MRQPHFIDKVGSGLARPSMYGYGLGTSVDGTGHVRWSHSGAFVLGVGTTVVFIPSGDIAITLLTNGQPHGIPEAIAAGFVDILETGQVEFDWLSLYEKAFAGFYVNHSELAGKTPPANPVPPKALKNYTGSYRSRYFKRAKIEVIDDHLVLSLGPAPEYFDLKHWNSNVFSYFPRGENAVGISAITFDSAVGTMTIEFLNEHGLGVFKRN